MSSDTSTGSDLPAMNATDDAAFKAMEAEAAQQRTAAPPPPPPAQQQQKVEPPPPPPPAQQQQVEDDDPRGVLASDGKKYLPVAVHVQERKAWQGQKADLEAVNQQLRQQYETAMAALARVVPPAQQQQQQKPEPPPTNPHDKEMHPLDHMRWENEQLQARLAKLEGHTQQNQQMTEQQQALHRQQQAYANAHATYAKNNPTFGPAYSFVMDKMVEVHKAMGHSEQVAIQMANAVEWQTVTDAVNRKQNPFVVLEQLAKTFGYVPGQQQQQTLTPEQQLKKSQEAAAAAITLSGQPGGGAAVASLQSLVAMPKEAFAAAFAGPDGDAKFEKLAMGG